MTISEKSEVCLRKFAEQSETVAPRCREGIEKYRKGNFRIVLKDERGNPLKGKKVTVRQRTHDFKFGANIFLLDEFKEDWKNKAYRKMFKEYFNLATVPFYWNDLEPEEEAHIGQYVREELGSDFVFITHYPTKKRPFYAMDDPEDPTYTLSFDLLFRGLEVTTGGQRIHDYRQQVAKMKARGMDPADFESYLMIHKHGMPPHGGLGIGLERLTMQLCGLDNIRQASLFPRDRSRLDP